VFKRVIYQLPILEKENFISGIFLHQNRLELLTPPFLSREKVATDLQMQFSLIIGMK